jgi:regulator of nonsense transcripts 3
VAQPTSTPLLDHLRIHGKSGGRSKGKTTASSSDARGRAIASVTAAAAKRAPHADNGPILVAGKGREVTMVDSVPTPAPNPNPKKKGGKKREKGPNASPAIDGTPATAPNTRTSTPQTQNTNTSHQSLPPRPPRSAKPRPERATDGQPPVGREPRIDGEAGRPQGRPRREDPNGAEGASGGGGRGGGRGRGGRGARRGGGADRGDGDGKDRSARGAVVSILTRNSEPGEGRGGRGGGRGRGRGGGPGAAAASTARIDD